ncbi:hypothetical protein CGG88_12005 [Vibrio parahaemolyticus]|uniref:hypothetical protein n=1 Tax=Vibrio parahaemolyticus TaxID=670 RepID=UPI001122966B|nr:hypothetical protein [Vibrio parahaemolyticus]TOQ81085.1 hypothetical protein CGG88_12005 [Vibrio parahaemolyticus]
MAKSNTNASALKHKERREAKPHSLLTDRVSLKVKGDNYPIELDRLRFYGCNLDGKLDESRQQGLDQFRKSLHESLRSNGSNATWYNLYRALEQYLMHCDSIGLLPFSKEGFRSYNCMLWARIRAYNPHKAMWQYEDSEVLGITEKSARAMNNYVRSALQRCGVFDNAWALQLKPFSRRGITPHTAYSYNELLLITRRLLSYFSDLVEGILKSKSTTKPVNVTVDGVTWQVGGGISDVKTHLGEINFQTPFNHAMVSAYYLLAYFTAFNDAPLKSLCRPIQRTGKSKIERSEEWYSLNAKKSRVSGKTVTAEVGGDVINGKILKNGYTFLEQLHTLSDKFHDESDGLLLYLLDRNGKPHPLTDRCFQFINLSQELWLTSELRIKTVEPLLRTFRQLVNSCSYEKVWQDFASDRVRRKSIDVSKHPRYPTIKIAFALLDMLSLGKARLKNITLPLTLYEDRSIITAKFKYDDGTSGELKIPAQYRIFLELLISFSKQWKPDFKSHAHYLLPWKGNKNVGFTPWSGLAPGKMLSKMLKELGLLSGDYLINLNSSRLRESNATLARHKQRNELAVNQILQNSLDIQLQSYSTEYPSDNQRIMSQSMQVIEGLKSGDWEEVEEVKQNVAMKLKLPLLTFDESRKHNVNITISGIGCKGGDTTKQTAQDTRTKRQGLDPRYQLHCSQYDQCITCPNAHLIDDADAMWRLLSFVELLKEAEDLNGDCYTVSLGETVRQINLILHANISKKTLEKAQNKLRNEGRHPYWTSPHNLTVPRKL